MVMFAHDFPAEVNSRLKEYKDIRKILKEKQIRFQTPYPAKMKIYWDNGACVYNNATKAAEDMIKRGYPVDLPQTNVMDWEQKLTRACIGILKEILPNESGGGSVNSNGSRISTNLT